MSAMGETLRLRLDLPGPLALVVINDGDPPLCGRAIKRQLGEFARDLRNFRIGRCRFAVRAQKAGMHLLLRERRLPPTEIGHDFGAMRKRFPRPKPRHAGQGIGVERRPVHRTGLLFHDPPPAMAYGTIKVMVKRRIVRIALAHEEALGFFRLVAHREVPQWIAVPACHIQRLAERVMVEIGDPAHEVVDHWKVRASSLKDIELYLVEGGDLVGGIAAKVKRMGRRRLGDQEVRQLNLVEPVVFHGPEHRAPGLVQCLYRPVFLRQPALETVAGSRRIAVGRVVAAVLVVCLPSSKRGMLA